MAVMLFEGHSHNLIVSVLICCLNHWYVTTLAKNVYFTGNVKILYALIGRQMSEIYISACTKKFLYARPPLAWI